MLVDQPNWVHFWVQNLDPSALPSLSILPSKWSLHFFRAMSAQALQVHVGIKDFGTPGLIDVVEVSIPQQENKVLRVEDLVSSIDELMLDSRRVISVKLNGARVMRTRELDQLIPESKQGIPRFIATTVQGPFVQVVLKSQTGKEVCLKLFMQCTIKLLKSIIERSNGKPTKQLRLEYASIELEDDRTLGSYGFKSGGVISVSTASFKHPRDPHTVTNLQQAMSNNPGAHDIKSVSNDLRLLSPSSSRAYVSSMPSLHKSKSEREQNHSQDLGAPLCADAQRVVDNVAVSQAISSTAAQSALSRAAAPKAVCHAAAQNALCAQLNARRVFADVSNNSLLERRSFSKSGPRWRTCSKGLNIEGKCTKRGCEAFGKMIIHRKHFAAFNLLRDGNVTCPVCSESVEPITCGFYDCEWKFEGVKAEDGCMVSSPWKSARGKHYYRFRTDESEGTVEWKSLLISVKPVPSSVDDECVVCFEDMNEDTKIAESCGHWCHRSCAAHVAKANAMNDALLRCARCNETWNNGMLSD